MFPLSIPQQGVSWRNLMFDAFVDKALPSAVFTATIGAQFLDALP
jgi:hypothetical protein